MSWTIYIPTFTFFNAQPLFHYYYCIVSITTTNKMKPPNSGYPKQRKYLEQRTNCLVPNVTVFVKLPPGSGYLLITGKFFKTRRCPLFRGFTVLLLLLVVAVIVAVLSLLLSLVVALMIYQYYFPYQLLFLSLFYNQYTPSVFVLSCHRTSWRSFSPQFSILVNLY